MPSPFNEKIHLPFVASYVFKLFHHKKFVHLVRKVVAKLLGDFGIQTLIEVKAKTVCGLYTPV